MKNWSSLFRINMGSIGNRNCGVKQSMPHVKGNVDFLKLCEQGHQRIAKTSSHTIGLVKSEEVGTNVKSPFRQ